VKPIVLTKGTKIECTAHYDIHRTIQQSGRDEGSHLGRSELDEMMLGFFDVAFDAKCR